MKTKKTLQEVNFLEEISQFKIHGGTSTQTGSNFIIYIFKSCRTWGDCRKVCPIIKPTAR